MMALAIYDGELMAFMGMLAAARFFKASYSICERPAFLQRFVSTKDGATALTLTPNGESSIAALLVSISRPALLIQQLIIPGSGLLPLSLLTLTTQPRDACRSSRKIYMRMNGVLRFISVMLSNSCGVVDSISPGKMIPAQLTRISRPPNLSFMAVLSSRRARSSWRSHCTARA